MIIEIKDRWNGRIIFSIEAENIKEALNQAVRSGANLSRADLYGANLSGADLSGANLYGADLYGANLYGANLYRANLSGANLSGASLSGADLSGANLSGANLYGANLSEADLYGANLYGANLYGAGLSGAKGLVKVMGVEIGNYYWKRFDQNLNNNNYQFYIGLNKLPENEEFADDDRINCSFPGFYFASRSWCRTHYPNRPLEAKIRIPEGAKINEPWQTNGKASADMIEILQVFNVDTGDDVTDKFKRK